MATDRRSFLLQTAGALTGIALLPEALPAEPLRLAAPVRLGLIGAGRQGRAIIGELQQIPDATLGVICDTNPARLRTAAERAPRVETAADHRAVLGRADIDAVIIATPTHLHRQIVTDAIQAGKHVYCETPLAHTIEDAQAMVQAAAGATKIVAAGLQPRANPVYLRAASFLGSDTLREPVSFLAQANLKTTWRFPASDPAMEQQVNWRLDPEVTTGLAGELGSHQFAVAAWFLGKLPARITGRGSIRLHQDGRTIADTVAAEMVWPDGVTLQWSATLASSFAGQYEVLHAVNASIRLAGTHAWLFKEVDSPTQGWEVYATRQQFFRDEGIVLVADATKLAAQGRLKEGGGLPHTPLYYALADFLTAAAEGKRPACSLADAFPGTASGILAHQAIVSGEPVTVPSGL
ncbi:MAG TPA: Gfo/Idh/MocA family oxidoreductase [Gemmatimonadales bacterium]|nr:Gfo/Idh/MocA family oxidoreductase [Gemmatimonadales bacterium]